ncbi:MAG: A/G-specific adenine glycosylase [Bacteroidales bacterium]|nr:A/G-specific adenine glycosylase [Bacteroidales bacterium]
MENAFSATILNWYSAFGRDLPWRRTRNPYAIWLSEIILQQTRIAQGQAYWERFMAHLPDVQALAAATEDEVLRLWEGLGYYSRARNLHVAARQIVAMGGFPDTLEGIRALKGIGDYTAAAIGSIAFGIPAAVVDGNVYRVLGRHFGIETPVGTSAAKKEFTDLAQSLLPEDRPGDFNQGMMDFGALQCTPANPACITCPLAASCAALREGRVESLPVKKAGATVQVRPVTYVYLRCNGQTAIRRRGPGDIWQGLWEPLTEILPGLEPHLLKSGVRHQLTHRTLIADFYLAETDRPPALPNGYQWIQEAELDRFGKPRLFELLLQSLP